MKNHESRITNYQLPAAKMLGGFLLLIIAALHTLAQSTSQSYPTPVTSNEISGRIPARDLGDARLTGFYYTFDGRQGDVFINVVTTNFNGDIDVFTADNLRPLTKITAYADAPNGETGRVIYLRQPVKLILRIEGRTPNDDAATFQIKFAGSFAPSMAIAETNAEPEVKSNNQSDVRVNSVGTIIQVKPSPTPAPREVIAKVEEPSKATTPVIVAGNGEKPVAEKSVNKKTKETIAKKTPKPKKEKPVKIQPPISVAEEPSKKETDDTKAQKIAAKKEAKAEQNKIEKEKAESAAVTAPEPPKEKKKSTALKPVPPAELANINLIILFKDGSKIARPMSEILKFGVDQGILTVISKDGAIGRYSILDVEKMTVE